MKIFDFNVKLVLLVGFIILLLFIKSGDLFGKMKPTLITEPPIPPPPLRLEFTSGTLTEATGNILMYLRFGVNINDLVTKGGDRK